MRETKDYPEEPISDSEIGAGRVGRKTLKHVGIIGGIALAAFLLGFIPMWLSARNVENDSKAARESLRLSVLQNNLATATINAYGGEFEQARQQTSDFFTALRAEMERENSAISEGQRESVHPILAQRDETITLLARSDSAAADRLSGLYFAFMQAKNPIASKARLSSNSGDARKDLLGIRENKVKEQ